MGRLRSSHHLGTFWDVFIWAVIVVGVSVMVVGLVKVLEGLPGPERDVYINNCVVENKTLPNPKQYCEALWYQKTFVKDK